MRAVPCRHRAQSEPHPHGQRARDTPARTAGRRAGTERARHPHRPQGGSPKRTSSSSPAARKSFTYPSSNSQPTGTVPGPPSRLRASRRRHSSSTRAARQCSSTKTPSARAPAHLSSVGVLAPQAVRWPGDESRESPNGRSRSPCSHLRCRPSPWKTDRPTSASARSVNPWLPPDGATAAARRIRYPGPRTHGRTRCGAAGRTCSARTGTSARPRAPAPGDEPSGRPHTAVSCPVRGEGGGSGSHAHASGARAWSPAPAARTRGSWST